LPTFSPLDPPDDEPMPFVAALTPAAVDYPNGVSLKADDQRLRLTGISGIGRNGVCLAGDGTRFACGLQSRASLSLAIAGAKVTCYRDQALPPGTDGYLCSANGRDLALAQIMAGYALPTRPSIDRLQEALAAAMAAHAGAWNGGWALIPSPMADSDMIP
jgi:endonuclease YncB( thermonuclease family)